MSILSTQTYLLVTLALMSMTVVVAVLILIRKRGTNEKRVYATDFKNT